MLCKTLELNLKYMSYQYIVMFAGEPCISFVGDFITFIIFIILNPKSYWYTIGKTLRTNVTHFFILIFCIYSRFPVTIFQTQLKLFLKFQNAEI